MTPRLNENLCDSKRTVDAVGFFGCVTTVDIKILHDLKMI